MNYFRSGSVWIYGFLISSVIGLFNFVRFIAGDLRENVPEIPYIRRMIDESTGVYSLYLLIPVLITFIMKYRLDLPRGYRWAPLHLLFFMVIGTSHTVLMTVSRKILYPLFLGVERDVPFSLIWIHEIPQQFIIYCGFVGLTYFVVYFRENKNREIKSAQLESQLTKAKLDVLRLQLNPHFLFNTLNMISSIMYTDVKLADKMLARLSDLLRHVLNGSKRQVITLAEEFELLQHYVYIMKARFAESLVVDISMDPECNNALFPGFILQPIVENSLKHGMDSQCEMITVTIIVQKVDSRIQLMIQDDGLGLKESSIEETLLEKGTGLSSINKRLQLLYSDDFSFKLIQREEGGVVVSIDIPFQTEPLQTEA